MGVVPHVQSKLLRALHAHRGKKPLQDLQNLESTAMERAIVRFRGAQEKGAMAFVKCLGVLLNTRWGASCGGRPLAGAWGCMTRRNLLVGCVMAMVTDKKPPVSTPYLAQRWDGALSLTVGCSTRHWLDPFARSKSSLLLKTHGPSERELADKTSD